MARRRSSVERTNALAALRNLAEDADNQQLIAEMGGIPLVVAQLRSGSDAHKAFAAGTLWHLAERADLQVEIAAAGGVPALVELARSGVEVQRENATGALMKLAEAKQNRSLIVKAGGVAVLVGSIQGSSHAATAGDNANQVAQETIRDGYAVPATVAQVGERLTEKINSSTGSSTLGSSAVFEMITRYVNDLGSANKSKMHAAAVKLEPLTLRGATRAKIVQAGGVQALFALLSDEKVSPSKHVVRDLRNVFAGVQQVPGVTCEEVVAPFVALLRSGNPDHQEAAAAALNNLAQSPLYKSVIGYAGAIPLLITLSQENETHDDDRVNAEPSAALLRLAKSPLNWLPITEAGGLKNLVIALMNDEPHDQAVATAALRAILATLHTIESKHTVEVVTAAVMLIENGSDRDKIHGCAILRTIAAQEETRAIVDDAGGLTALTNLVRRGTEAQRELAATVLRALSTDGSAEATATTSDKTQQTNSTSVCGEGAKSGGPSREQATAKAMSSELNTFVGAIQDGDGSMTRNRVAQLLQALENKRTVVNTLAVSSTIAELVTLLRGGNNDQKTSAASDLQSLARFGLTRAKLVELGGVPALCSLLKSEVDEHKTTAARALCTVFAGTRHALGMSSDEVVAAVVELLRTGSDEQKEIAADAVKHLAATPLFSAAIGYAGAVPILAAMDRVRTVAQRPSAAAAMLALATSPLHWVPIAQGGGFLTFIWFLRKGSTTQKKATAAVLRGMTAMLYKHPAVEKSAVLAASIALTRHGVEPWDQIHGCVVMRNMAAEQANTSDITTCGGVKALNELLTHDSDALKCIAQSALRLLEATVSVDAESSKVSSVQPSGHGAAQPSVQNGEQHDEDEDAAASERAAKRAKVA